ncbi:hypothetical protein ACFQZC_16245 [Streptacidiphilus monticola]
MSDTLAAVKVSVSGRTAVTLDARRGKRVSASVDATSGAAAGSYNAFETAVACPANNWGGLVGVYNVPGEIYEIPNARATEFQFGWMQTWTGADYYAVNRTTKGLPANPTAYFRRSSMARVNLAMRSGETSQPVNGVMANPSTGGQGCTDLLYGSSDLTGSGTDATAWLSSGQWQVRGYNTSGAWTLDTNDNRGPVKLTGGHSYWLNFGRAVWGPTAGLPVVDRRSIRFTPYATIADVNSGTGATADTRNTVTLSKAGHVLKRQTLTTSYGSAPTFSAGIASAGWYSLSVTSTRKLRAQLSTTVTLAWHFHADPRVSEVAPATWPSSPRRACRRRTRCPSAAPPRCRSRWHGPTRPGPPASGTPMRPSSPSRSGPPTTAAAPGTPSPSPAPAPTGSPRSPSPPSPARSPCARWPWTRPATARRRRSTTPSWSADRLSGRDRAPLSRWGPAPGP